MRKPWERGPSRRGKPGAKVLLLACLGLIGSGCAWIVPRAEFEEKQKQDQASMTAIRTELLAHTQILANHGKAINEVRLQIRDALSGWKAAGPMAPAAPPGAPAMRPGPPRPAAGVSIGKTVYVRSMYQGLPLNYAAGYRAPRGARYSYRLPPGTEVTALSGDDRGFTHVEVKAGPLKGRRMWVRTRWLVGERPARGPGRG
ncbi:MAG: hypothetical protein HYU38_04460 [Candidatus Tectomicrobia bacterium]|nr:hypothetical protein [Candidatus Tectomicrobia bacterium]